MQRSHLREADVETRASEFVRTIDVQHAAVAAHDVVHDRQADAVPLHALVAAHATLQELERTTHDHTGSPAERRALAQASVAHVREAMTAITAAATAGANDAGANDAEDV